MFRDDDDQLFVYHVEPLAYALLLEFNRYFESRAIQYKKVDLKTFTSMLQEDYETDDKSTLDAMDDLQYESYDDIISSFDNTSDLLDNTDHSAIVRFINSIIQQAMRKKVSDIHFEVFEDKVNIRFRLDGVLQDVIQPPRSFALLIASRLKIMAHCDIAEKRLPQDGRLSVKLGHHMVDIRLSTIPTHYGERIVLRLLDKNATPLDLAALGFEEEELLRLRRLIHRPYGVILVTGPTGSGKTTTLYSALTELNDGARNILTIEDPIEYYLEGIGQTQVNTKIGMDFVKGLRAILRQDPDIVMVGEVRDSETVKIATQASLTGHLVFSTLHTNTAVGAVSRLRDMGVPPYLIASSLIGVLAQRLVRRLCDDCKQEQLSDDKTIKLLGLDKPCTLYQPVGCQQCYQTGYKGRVAVYDLLVIDDHMKSMIAQAQDEAIIYAAVQEGENKMLDQAKEKVLAGITSTSEYIKIHSEVV